MRTLLQEREPYYMKPAEIKATLSRRRPLAEVVTLARQSCVRLGCARQSSAMELATWLSQVATAWRVNPAHFLAATAAIVPCHPRTDVRQFLSVQVNVEARSLSHADFRPPRDDDEKRNRRRRPTETNSEGRPPIRARRRGRKAASGPPRGHAAPEPQAGPGRAERAGDRRVARPRPRRIGKYLGPRLRREGHDRPRARPARPASSASTSRTGSSPKYVTIKGKDPDPRRAQEGRQDGRAPSTSRPTLTARARRSPGTWPSQLDTKAPHPPGPVPRDHQGRGQGGDGEPGRDRRRQGERAAGAPHPRPPGRLQGQPDPLEDASRPASPPDGCRPWRSA